MRTVSRHRVKLGIANDPSIPLSEEEKQIARQLLEDGATYAEAARTLGRDRKCVANALPGYPVLDKSGASQLAVLGRKLAELERGPLFLRNKTL